jgi:hypothetical protein
VYEEIEAGNLAFDDMIYISRRAARASTAADLQGQAVPLPEGAYHTVDTMMHLLLLPSSNGAGIAFAEHISGSEEEFVARMNETAYNLGIFAEFFDSHGASARREHLTNAHSMAFLTREFMIRYPDIIRVVSARYMRFEGRTWNNTNRFLRDRPYEGADGFKTGTTREAGFCLVATAARDGRRIITVTMAGLSNDMRYGDNRALLDFGFEELARRDAERIAVYIGGERLMFSVSPQIVSGHIMAPLYEILVFHGLDTAWVDFAFTVGELLLIGHSFDDVLEAHDNHEIIASYAGYSELPPQIISGALMVPITFVMEFLGRQLTWDDEMRVVYVE